MTGTFATRVRSTSERANRRGLSSSLASSARWLSLGWLLFAACSGDDRAPVGGPSGSSAGAGGGSSAGSAGSAGRAGNAGTGAGTGDAGEGGEGAAPSGCGDGVRDGDEDCDGDDFGTATCQSYGFDEGALTCTGTCAVSTSDCSGAEHCADGRDNDGDGEADCNDDECSAACQNPCAAPQNLPDPSEISASTVARVDVLSSTCSESSDQAGPDVVYRFVAEHTGTLELALESTKLMHVVVASSCDSAESEPTCESDLLSVPVTAGDELYIVVESHSSSDAGEFQLTALSRENGVCGDGYRDDTETCDDGNLNPYDGCDVSCELEASELEPNDEKDDATPYTDGFFGQVSPGDEDVISVVLAEGPASITADLLGLGDDCSRRETDSFLELLSSDGLTVIDSDDDSGEGFCSRLVASGLAAGTYYLRVSASASGDTPAFPYELAVKTNHCGDGTLGPGEECDGGAGCSDLCTLE